MEIASSRSPFGRHCHCPMWANMLVSKRDAPFDILGGGWKKIEINSLSPQKSEKINLLKMWAEKNSLFAKLMKNMLTRKTTKC